MSKSPGSVILRMTALEDRTTPAGLPDPYLPPPPPAPPVVVIVVPIVKPPMMPNIVAPPDDCA